MVELTHPMTHKPNVVRRSAPPLVAEARATSLRYPCGDRDQRLLFEEGIEVGAIERVLWAIGVLGFDQGRGASHHHHDIVDSHRLGVGDHIRITQAAGPAHQINHYFINHSDDDMVANIVIGDVCRRVVFENGESLPHTRHVPRRIVDEQIDVFSESARAMRDHGEAANQHVTGGVLV